MVTIVLMSLQVRGYGSRRTGREAVDSAKALDSSGTYADVEPARQVLAKAHQNLGLISLPEFHKAPS